MNSPEHLPPFAARLEPARRELESAMTPFVGDLSDIPSINSGVLFVADRRHHRSAGAVAQVYAPDRPDKIHDFTKNNIEQHRVDINPSTTTVGQTFETHQSLLSPSLMNPDGHVVWGAYMAPVGDSEAAVLQLAFDKSQTLPSEKTLADIWKQYEKTIEEATESLIIANRDRPSLANDLLLEEPVTSNGFVIKWDISKSTKMVNQQYPLFRQYLEELELRIKLLAKEHDGRIVSYNGDGHNIVVDLPADINRNNFVEIGAFGRRTAKPLMLAILAANAQISRSYGKLNPHIRIGLGLGHVESSGSGEETGTIFWNVADTIESLPRYCNSSQITAIAQRALFMARPV